MERPTDPHTARMPRESLRTVLLPFLAIVVLAIGLYANTLSHQWAFDDDLVYTENPAVLEGLAGIPSLLTSDAYAHLYERTGRDQELSGGRYRPLSLVSFALEVELFGVDPRVAHGRNVWLYALTCGLVFLVLRRAVGPLGVLGSGVPGRSWFAFVAAALFAAHPVHTEVVANVKGRDELLSLFFILLALWTAMGSGRAAGRTLPGAAAGPENAGGSVRWLGVAAFSFLALLAKEYAVLLIVLVPIARYVFRGATPRQAVAAGFPVLVALLVYVPLRVSAVGVQSVEAVDLLNDPYLLASPVQEWATQIYVLLRYVGLLVWPHPLACDYGYQAIAYRTLASPEVWISLVVHLGIITAGVLGVLRRHWIGFAAAFYLGPLVLVSNLIVDIGATMGERLVFHGSLGYVMVLAGSICWGVASDQRTVVRSAVFVAGMTVLGVYTFLTIGRNPAWYDDRSLFVHDVEVVPESARVQANAGRELLAEALGSDRGPASEESVQGAGSPGVGDGGATGSGGEGGTADRHALLLRAVEHLERAVEIDPEIVAAYFSLGVAYDAIGDLERTEAAWNEARERFPDHPLFQSYDPLLANRLAARAVAAAGAGDGEAARRFLERAVEYQREDGTLWFYLGRLSASLGDSSAAAEAFERARVLGVEGAGGAGTDAP